MRQFLKMLDVTTSKVAEDALLSVFVTRPDLFDSVEFTDAFWDELVPERAFLARVFVDHCKSLKVCGSLSLESRIEREY
jgi:condensin complex subunit 3